MQGPGTRSWNSSPLTPEKKQQMKKLHEERVRELEQEMGQEMGQEKAARERELVRYWGGSLASDWLLAAHHGSNTSTSAAWLRHVAPRETVLSHGYANPFGHPHNAVKMRLGAAGVGAVSAAEAGAIEYQLMRDGSLVRVLHRSKRGFWWM